MRFVDEIGQAINGLGTEFQVDGFKTQVTTNPAGLALFENATTFSATIEASQTEPLDEILAARWKSKRKGSPPKAANQTEVVFRGSPIGPLAVKAVVSNTVVISPPLGQLFAQLFDKSGRVLHAVCDYTITGAESFEGKTDDEALLLHEDVFPGDYELELTLKPLEGDSGEPQKVKAPLVVLSPDAATPLVRCLGAVPYSVLARLQFFFNTAKAFLLPTAVPGMRLLRKLYLQNTPSELLVVGHCDTAGSPALNDRLSLERAQATIAFLKDDVEAWLKFYDHALPAMRWGKPEDRMLLISMPDFACKPRGEDSVRWFQRTRKLGVDGKIGSETRRQLITEYMDLDGESLQSQGFEINATAHGCGENFPVDDGGAELDPAPEDDKRDPADRRVELYFFEPEFGIMPPPPGKNSAPGSTQYPAWRKSVIQTHELTPDEFDGPRVAFIELLDALFRTNSAVVLPEGEAPDQKGEHQALTAIGLIATALRLNESSPGKKLLLAGHTDTTASVEFNQKLSVERARTALSLLVGGKQGREDFKKLCDARHTVADYKQILSWVDRSFSALVFACDPGEIDDDAASGAPAVKSFQAGYNRNKEALGVPAADDLAVDGEVGPLTWGAFFDCYESALRDELGEKADGVEELRAQLRFVDDKRKALGFSEHFPIEELGVDDFKSQSNRRVEILFFASGEEPDLVAAEAEPATSELYLPGGYVRIPVPPFASGRAHDILVPVRLDLNHEPTRGVNLELVGDSGLVLRVAHDDPEIEEDDSSKFRLYPFRSIPLGRYRLDVVMGESRSTSLRGIQVKAQGVFLGTTLLNGPGELAAPEELELEFPPEDDFFTGDTFVDDLA